ncbi:hypothetical protein F5Y12DRAFT_247102 [Xylaria sp. FL1777]|nr:hypothetical protein F5Y12DRAFT_247102 [Xylaria sp. FL1777]
MSQLAVGLKATSTVLAGRLYVDQSERKAVAEYVRGSSTGAAHNPDKIAADPAAFLLEWLTIRRKTVGLLHTPMAYICTRREMESADSSEGITGDQWRSDKKTTTLMPEYQV